MKKMSKKIYMAAGYNTVSLGTGRKEFNPKKPRPNLEHYISEAGKGTLEQIGGAKNVDESVIGNFMASRFNNQGHLAGFIPMIDEGLKFKPSVRVEAACASGGMALITGIKNVLAGADAVLSLGMIPPVQRQVVETVANGAGLGAAMFLSDEGFARGEAIAAKAEQVDLDVEADFMERYVGAMALDPDEIELP